VVKAMRRDGRVLSIYADWELSALYSIVEKTTDRRSHPETNRMLRRSPAPI
jgi:hypothetical protein